MSKMTFSSPQTTAQETYFARSAQLRFWAGLLVVTTPVVWGIVDFVGLSGLIMPNNPLLSNLFTGLLLVVAHGILIASAMMAGYDIFDNNRVEHPILAVLPLLLALGLLYFSWTGAENIYLNNYAHKATVETTDVADATKKSAVTDAARAYQLQRFSVEKAKNIERKSVRSRFAKELSNAEKLKVVDENDRRFRAAKVNAVVANINAAIGRIDEDEAKDLSQINLNERDETKNITTLHSRIVATIGEKNHSEMAHQMRDENSASGKSFWFSIALCGSFFMSVLARTRTDCKSGIIPQFEHTDGDKSDRVRETLFVINAILGSQYSRALRFLHDNLAIEYSEIKPKRKSHVKSDLPPPPTPPNNNGGNGGNNDGTPPPPLPTPPANAELLPSSAAMTDARRDLGANATEEAIRELARFYDKPRTPTPSVKTLSDSTIEATAAHEAAHVCFMAYLVAFCNGKLDTDLIAISINPEKVNENSVSLGHYKVKPFNLKMSLEENKIYLEQIAAGYAGEYCISYNNMSLPKFLAIRDAPVGERTDIDAFEKAKIVSTETKNDDFFKYVESAALFLAKDDTMLRVVTTALLEKKEIVGQEASDLFKTLVSFYKSKLQKETLSTPSVISVVQPPILEAIPEIPIKTVAQPKPTVAQQSRTDLDDKLELLTAKLKKESSSQFTNTQSNNDSVRNRICRILDEAVRALIVPNAQCDNEILNGFIQDASFRLALMEKYGCKPYDSHQELLDQSNKRLAPNEYLERKNSDEEGDPK